MYDLKGSVGYGAANNPEDVAAVQVWLKHVSGSKSYFTDIPLGTYGGDLGSNIAIFQEDENILKTEDQQKNTGILRPNSLTHRQLRQRTNSELGNLKVYFAQSLKPTFFLRNEALSKIPAVFKLEDIKLPKALGLQVQSFLKQLIITYSDVVTDLSGQGEFCITLKTKEKFYDAVSAKVITGLSQAYFDYIVKNIKLRDWVVTLVPNRCLVLKFKKQAFYAGPHALSEDDIKRLQYWEIPTPYTRPANNYEKKLLSTVVRPWRKIVQLPNETTFSTPPQSATDKTFSFQACEALAYAQSRNYSKGLKAAFDAIANNTGRKPLVFLSMSAEFKAIVGVYMKAGVILDPNTQKEYLYIKVGISAGLGYASGFSAGVETLDKRIEDVDTGWGGGASLSHEIAIGPFAMSLLFSTSGAKVPVFKWKGVSGLNSLLGIDDDGTISASGPFDFSYDHEFKRDTTKKPKNLLSLAGDLETGERLGYGEKSQGEKRFNERSKQAKGKEKIKQKLLSMKYSLLEVDFGSFILDFTVEPKVSGKVKIEFGPEIHGDYTFLIDIDTSPWYEDAVYAVVKGWLPNIKPIFPLTKP